MSYTELYVVKKDGEVAMLGECRNAFRGAMWIWTELSKKYFPGGALAAFGEDLKKVWALAKGDRLTDTEYYALLSTFDNAMVSPEHAPLVIDALETFEPGTENLIEQARLMRSVLVEGNGTRGFCWNQTSVNGDAWRRRAPEEEVIREVLDAHAGQALTPGFIEELVEELSAALEDRERLYNIDKQKDHWWIVPRGDAEIEK